MVQVVALGAVLLGSSNTKKLAEILSPLPAVEALAAQGVLERLSILRPWKSNDQPLELGRSNRDVVLGWTKERRDPVARRYHVLVGWNANAGESQSQSEVKRGQDRDSAAADVACYNEPSAAAAAAAADIVSIDLPFLEEENSLASSLWPGSLAAAILCTSPTLRETVRGRQVLELGSGLGLTGLAVAAAGPAASCTLTDHDAAALEALQDLVAEGRRIAPVKTKDSDDAPSRLRVEHLDWRDEPRPNPPRNADVVVASDVAYYYHLLRPLMDAAQSHLRPVDSLWLTVGQANREMQWQLHHALKDGCYNLRTDEREGPWPGMTDTYLYRLDVHHWQPVRADESSPTLWVVDGTLPIAALLHQTPRSLLGGPPLVRCPAGERWDRVATDDDEASLEMSF